jgi:hypothetical protein
MKMNGILNLKIVALILKAIYIIYFKVNNAGIHFAGIFILKIRFENYNIYIKWLIVSAQNLL